MADLSGQTIASSYEQLLSLPDGGGNANTLVAVTDGDAGTTFGIKLATNKVEIIPGSNDTSAFEVSQADGTAVLTVDSTNARVGIGTNSPSKILDIVTPSDAVAINLRTRASDDTFSFITWKDNDLSDSEFFAQIAGKRTGTDAGELQFYTSGDNLRLVIDNSGKVGIGTSSPANESSGTLLHIADTGGSNAAHINLSGGDGADGSQTGKISFSDPGDTDDAVAFISSNISGSNASPGGSLHFFTAVDGSSMAERMKIDSSGKVSMFSGGSHASTSASVYADNLVIRGSNNSNGSGITIFSENDEFGTLYFGDGGSGADAYRGYVQYSHSANELQLGSDGSTRLIIDSDGKVGIGTSSVGASCDMELRKGGATAGDGSGNAGFRFRLARNVGDLNSGDQIGQIAFSNNNDATGGIIQAKADADWASNDYPTRLEFYTTSDGSGDVAERMRIDSSGNVGIGTTSPQRDFVISNGGAGGMEFGAGDTASLISLFNRSNNTYTEFDIEAKEVHFLTGTSPAETMRLDANGNLGINETNPSSAKLVIKTSADGARCADFLHTDSTVTSADEIMRLRFSGDADATGGRFIALEDSNERIGDIGALNSTQVSYTVGSSDRNKKKNFEDWNESVLDELNKANPQMFHFKKQEDSEEKTKGYIAQDLKDAFPEAYPLNAVKEEGEWKDYYYFNPSGMVVYLMKAVQELSAKVTELEKKLGE